MSTSNLQESTRERVKEILNGFDVYVNYRPNWLKNPKTNKNLELDFYIPEVKVAIEVQGQQHYTFNTMFHKTEEDFIGV